MSEMRKPSTRYRGEPPPKRRTLTPPPRAVPEPVQLEDLLPMKMKDGLPLPTLSENQGLALPSHAFQDISER